MNFIVLTQYNGMIVGPVAKLLGLLMNALFEGISAIGIPNIGLAIILFTIVVNLLLVPITIKTQKNMKLNTVISPEVAKVTAKYRGKKDQESVQRQQKETQMIYDRYGYNPTSGCLPTLIQFPIMIALYRVIYTIPGYVTAIKEQFQLIVDAALTQSDFVTKIADLASSNMMSPDKFDLSGKTPESVNYIIDLFYKFDGAEWNTFKELFPSITDQINPVLNKITEMNSFLGGISLNEAPHLGFSVSMLIPILAWFTQWLNMKVSTAGSNQNRNTQDDPTAATMKGMNTFMPIMSAVFCISLPAGLGLYWIAGAVVRTVIQVFVNKHFDKIGVEAIIEESIAKQNKKRAKQGLPELKVTGDYLHGADVQPETSFVKKERTMPVFEKNTADSSSYYQKKYENGSIAARARMVKNFEEKENRK